MTWEDMHIGIDLGLQANNSNLFNKLEKEGKDYFLNRTIYGMISTQIDVERNTQTNVESYKNIRAYSSLLEPILGIRSFDKYTGDGTYDYITLPKDALYISTGKLWAGRSYRITVPGTTNLTAFGSTSPPIINTTFTCVLADVTATTLVIGDRYRILTVGTSNFLLAGSTSNRVGTEFIATSTNAAGGIGTVTTLSKSPTWSGTTLVYTTNESLYEFISSYSNIDNGQVFGTGPLTKGVKYKVVTGGTITNLNTLGSPYTTVVAGDMFLCTVSGTPLWNNSGVTLIGTKTIQNRLPIVQDVTNFLSTAYGSSTTTPLTVLINGDLRVYHDGKFTINEISVVYVKSPLKVDSINNVNTNLPESYHGKIIDDTIQFIMAYTNNPSYQAVLNENNTNRT
jgi:hypothetical protein